MNATIESVQPVLSSSGYRDASVFLKADEENFKAFSAGGGGHTAEGIPFVVSELHNGFVNLVPFFDRLGLRTPKELHDSLIRNPKVTLWK